MNEAGLPSGLFGMIYERTPTGGPDFEDLAWLDPDERRAAVLLIGVDGDDAVVFRRHLSR